MAVIPITTKQEFETHVLKNTKLVVVDFWAAWCPPCRMMAPVLEKLATEMDKQLDVVKVDVEASLDNQQLASEHGVQGIPNMQVFRAGKVVDELIGFRPQPVLEDELRKHLAK